MNDIRNILFILIPTLLISCNAGNKSSDNKVSKNILSKTDSLRISDSLNHLKDLLPFLDTTIYVDITNVAMSDTAITPPLTLNKSKKLLYNYYKKKDFYINGNVPPMEVYEKLATNNKKGEYRLDVHFDTAYFLNLNGDKYYDAIIEYELLPPYGSGHCLGEPNKALIISNRKGYYLTGLEFIPEHFYFDSIKQVNPNTVNLYGLDNDCENWRINRHFKITITTK